MLRELRIENLLLIERAELRFGPGLNVITGETGAGKTVLARSLDLLLGGRPGGGIVRPGAGEAWVEGTFEMPSGLRADPGLAELAERLPAGDEVVLARRVGAGSGRSSAFVAGRAASAADLQALGSRLLAFYGQHEHRKLTLAAAQREILDGFGGHGDLLASYRTAHGEVTALARERDELLAREGARERDIDLLRFVLAEIEAAAIDPDAVDDMVAERDRLRHAESLRAGAAAALAAFAGGEDGVGAAGLSAEAEAALAGGAGIDRALAPLHERAAAAALDLAHLAAELLAFRLAAEADPARLEEVEALLAEVDRLARKHGGDVAAVLGHAERCRAELERLEGAAERGAELGAALDAAEVERDKLGRRLSKARSAAAPKLRDRVESELAGLAMEGARLEVALEPAADGHGPSGREAVELRVAANPGMPIAPLGEVASGGELSRVMLALAEAGAGGEVATLVFDEIDAGVGGKVARRVGERLRALVASRQVVWSTHVRVVKEAAGEATVARVGAVRDEAREEEIVRMLGAEADDEAAGRHAQELLAAA